MQIQWNDKAVGFYLRNCSKMANTDFACTRVLNPIHLLNPYILTVKFKRASATSYHPLLLA